MPKTKAAEKTAGTKKRRPARKMSSISTDTGIIGDQLEEHIYECDCERRAQQAEPTVCAVCYCDPEAPKDHENWMEWTELPKGKVVRKR